MMADSFDIEFHRIFDRVSTIVDLKDAYGVNAVNHRIELAKYHHEGRIEL
jgi:hypothetical protein